MRAVVTKTCLSRIAAPVALLLLALTTACSRPVDAQGRADTSQDNSRSLPFHQEDETPDSQSQPPFQDQQTEGQQSNAKTLPFKSSPSRILPTGTLLTVRLENSLPGFTEGTDRTFAAVMDEPLVVDGRVIVPRESLVRGRVESARVPASPSDVGYFRLILESVTMDGKALPLQTSSLFARSTTRDSAGSPSGDSIRDLSLANNSKAIRLKKGRRLTFRLTRPLTIGE
jgi:hypothetical protein